VLKEGLVRAHGWSRALVGFAGLLLVVGFSLLSLAASEKVLVVGHHMDPTTLSAVRNTTAGFQSVWTHISEQLVYYSPDGSGILPGLAKSWEWVDSQTLELNLRDGISFTNGEPFNAESATYSVMQFVKSPSYTYMLASGLTVEPQIVETYKVRFHLNMRYSPFLGFLARSVTALPPKHHAQVGNDAFGLAPVGTGPYLLDLWLKGNRIELARNPSYWGDPPPADRIIFKIIPEDAARVAAIETGEVDIAINIPGAAMDRLNAAAGVDVVNARGARKFAVQFDVKPSQEGNPLQDTRVRTALNLAVDKVAIVDQVLNGTADVLPGQWQAPWEFGYNPNVEMFPYDPGKAKALLAEAGYPNGFDLRFTYTVGRYPQDKEVGEVVVSYLEAVGLRVEQVALEFGAFLTLWNADQIGPYLWGLVFPADPHFGLNYLLVSGITHISTVVASDPVITGLVVAGTMETDPARRAKIYDELAVKMHDDPWMLYLFVSRDVYALRDIVKGFVPRTDQVVSLYDVKLESW
jgi:peptide/nickel transport system substrate-binding protein